MVRAGMSGVLRSGQGNFEKITISAARARRWTFERYFRKCPAVRLVGHDNERRTYRLRVTLTAMVNPLLPTTQIAEDIEVADEVVIGARMSCGEIADWAKETLKQHWTARGQ